MDDKNKLRELILNKKEFIINHKEEIYEQALVANFLPENSTVLELGGRTGTVSQCINKKLINKSNHLVIEPNNSFKNNLENLSQKLGFNLYMGVISSKPMYAEIWKHGKPNKYMNDNVEILRSIPIIDNQDIKKISNKHEIITLNEYSNINQLESKFNLKFDTIVSDCEGALPYIFEQNPQLYEQIKYIQLEWDSFKVSENDDFRNILLEKGFESKYFFGTSMFPLWSIKNKTCGTSNNLGHEVLIKN